MKAVGIILAGGNSKRLGELSKKRATAAMPMAGTYRSIDFTLSSMVNSNIQTVAVLTQYNSKSLNLHLNSSKWWDFGRKQGGLYVFNPTISSEKKDWYKGTADALYQNIDFLKSVHEPYVVIASGDGIYKMDFRDALSFHIDKKADITVVCTDAGKCIDKTKFGCIKTDSDDRITDFEEKPITSDAELISCGIYIIRRHLLIELLEKAVEEDRYDFVNDILVRYRYLKHICAYKLETYWSNIASVETYYKTNMDFLKPEIREFFDSEPAICSKIEDRPPAKYNPGAVVRNAIIAPGCIVNGMVENSVVFKGVYIGNNCVIRDSIVLNGAYIGDNTILENCIVEAGSVIDANESYCGSKEKQIIVALNNERY